MNTIFPLAFARPRTRNLKIMIHRQPSHLRHEPRGNCPSTLDSTPSGVPARPPGGNAAGFRTRPGPDLFTFLDDDRLDICLSEADWRRLVPPMIRRRRCSPPCPRPPASIFSLPGNGSRPLAVLSISWDSAGSGSRGRPGYLAAALAPLLARQGIAFKAVDNA